MAERVQFPWQIQTKAAFTHRIEVNLYSVIQPIVTVKLKFSFEMGNRISPWPTATLGNLRK